MFCHIDSEAEELVVAFDDGRFRESVLTTPLPASAEEDPNNVSVAIRDIEPGEEITENYRTHTLDAQLRAIGGEPKGRLHHPYGCSDSVLYGGSR